MKSFLHLSFNVRSILGTWPHAAFLGLTLGLGAARTVETMWFWGFFLVMVVVVVVGLVWFLGLLVLCVCVVFFLITGFLGKTVWFSFPCNMWGMTKALYSCRDCEGPC